MTKVNLSILMPAHNATRTITAALLSTYFTMPLSTELIVYLDGPGTQSPLLTLLKKSKRVRILEGELRIGLPAALNLLVQEARGEYIARMDADDIALPMRYLAGVRKISNQNADVVFSQSIIFGGKFPFGLIPQVPFPLTAEQANLHLVISNPFVHPSMIARKSAILNCGGYRECVAEDLDLWLRLASSGKRLVRVPFYGLLYRLHPNQITADPNFEAIAREDPRIRESLIGLLTHLGLDTDLGVFSATQAEARKLLSRKSWHYRVQEDYFRPLLNIVKSRLRSRP
jgi:glycosyltransferase involved in cell wall biosynthesis